MSSLFASIFFPPKLKFELTPNFKIGPIVLLGLCQGPISYTKLITAKESTFIVILMLLLDTQTHHLKGDYQLKI